tara:strand:- start:1083 stop:1535 length:453 start_codon:yes stop_codon:yes gene_type:complete
MSHIPLSQDGAGESPSQQDGDMYYANAGTQDLSFLDFSPSSQPQDYEYGEYAQSSQDPQSQNVTASYAYNSHANTQAASQTMTDGVSLPASLIDGVATMSMNGTPHSQGREFYGSTIWNVADSIPCLFAFVKFSMSCFRFAFVFAFSILL